MEKFFDFPGITSPFAAAYSCEQNPNSHYRPNFGLDADSDSGIGFSKGIPDSYAGKSNGSGIMKKGEMNQLGYLMTLGAFRSQRGVRQTFSQEVSDAIGGYPKGIILRYEPNPVKLSGAQELWRRSYDVVSMQDNNTKNFLKSTSNPSPYEIGSKVDGKVWWKYVEDRALDGRMSLLPDLLTSEMMTFDDAKAFPDCRFMNIVPELGYIGGVHHYYGKEGDGQHWVGDDSQQKSDYPGVGLAPIMQCNTYYGGTAFKIIVANSKEIEI